MKATRQFPNSPKGFAEFDKWVSKWEDPSVWLVAVMEATGVYYEALAWHLHRAGRQVAVVLPNRSRKYAQSLGCKSKNDRIDARSLAHMGRRETWSRGSP